MIEIKNNMMTVKTGYNREFAAKMKEMGGKWTPTTGWSLPADCAGAVDELLHQYFPEETPADPDVVTMRSRVDEIVADATSLYSGDTVARMVAFAFRYGQESEAKKISDQYAALIKSMKQKANESRYKKYILEIIGDKDYIYSKEYFGETIKKVGPLETEL